jgi:hypothetical protein
MINKNIKPRNDKGEPHDYWERYYYIQTKLWFKCFFHNGHETGYQEYHDYSKDKLIKSFYII